MVSGLLSIVLIAIGADIAIGFALETYVWMQQRP